MKTFKEFISESNDPRVKILMALQTQKERIEKHANTRFNRNSKRFYDLVDKYQELKDKAEAAGVWDIYCKKLKLSPKHDGYDFYA